MEPDPVTGQEVPAVECDSIDPEDSYGCVVVDRLAGVAIGPPLDKETIEKFEKLEWEL